MLVQVKTEQRKLEIWTKVHQVSLAQRRKDRSRQRRLYFVAIFIGSRNICAQTQKS